MGKYLSIKGTPSYILSQRKFYIEDIEVIPGSELNSNWQGDMQRVFTDKGIFIDNIVNPGNPTLTPGFDWPSVVGRTIEATINQSKNYYWISKE